MRTLASCLKIFNTVYLIYLESQLLYKFILFLYVFILSTTKLCNLNLTVVVDLNFSVTAQTQL